MLIFKMGTNKVDMTDFWENVLFLMRKENVPQKALAAHLEKSQSSLSLQMQRKRPTTITEAQNVSEFFGFHVFELMGPDFRYTYLSKKKEKNYANDDVEQYLTADEKELLKHYRGSTEEGKKAIRAVIDIAPKKQS